MCALSCGAQSVEWALSFFGWTRFPAAKNAADERRESEPKQ